MLPQPCTKCGYGVVDPGCSSPIACIAAPACGPLTASSSRASTSSLHSIDDHHDDARCSTLSGLRRRLLWPLQPEGNPISFARQTCADCLPTGRGAGRILGDVELKKKAASVLSVGSCTKTTASCAHVFCHCNRFGIRASGSTWMSTSTCSALQGITAPATAKSESCKPAKRSAMCQRHRQCQSSLCYRPGGSQTCQPTAREWTSNGDATACCPCLCDWRVI